MRQERFHNPNKHTLELLTQAQQDARENGHGTHSSGFDYIPFMTSIERACNDLDAPMLSRDRRFIIRIEPPKKSKINH